MPFLDDAAMTKREHPTTDRCDRCGVLGLTTPEIGPMAENVCTACLAWARYIDYQEYLELRQAERQPSSDSRSTSN